MEIATGQVPTLFYLCSKCRRGFPECFSSWVQELGTRSGLPSWKSHLLLTHHPPHPLESKSFSAESEISSFWTGDIPLFRGCSSVPEQFACLLRQSLIRIPCVPLSHPQELPLSSCSLPACALWSCLLGFSSTLLNTSSSLMFIKSFICKELFSKTIAPFFFPPHLPFFLF